MSMSPLYISLKTVSVATLVAFLLGLYAVRLVKRTDRRVNGVLNTIFILPMVLPPTVVGFILLLLFGKSSIVGRAVLSLGYQIIFSWPATVLAAFVVAFPLIYNTSYGAFEQVDSSLVNAARTLGLSEGQIFWHIMMPLAWPGIASGVVLGFARALGEFGATMMIAGNIPGRTQTIPLAIYFAVQGGDMKTAMFWVVVVVAISFAVIMSINHWSGKQVGLSVHRRK